MSVEVVERVAHQLAGLLARGVGRDRVVDRVLLGERHLLGCRRRPRTSSRRRIGISGRSADRVEQRLRAGDVDVHVAARDRPSRAAHRRAPRDGRCRRRPSVDARCTPGRPDRGMSPSMNSKRSVARRFTARRGHAVDVGPLDRLAVERVEVVERRGRAARVRSRRRATVFEPMNPAPPVTRTSRMQRNIVARSCRAAPSESSPRTGPRSDVARGSTP